MQNIYYIIFSTHTKTNFLGVDKNTNNVLYFPTVVEAREYAKTQLGGEFVSFTIKEHGTRREVEHYQRTLV